jgi:hypothetical protein
MGSSLDYVVSPQRLISAEVGEEGDADAPLHYYQSQMTTKQKSVDI